MLHCLNVCHVHTPTDGDGDAYGFIDTNKDRKEVIREVEEPLKTVWVHLDKRGEYPSQSAAKDLVAAEIFGLGRCE